MPLKSHYFIIIFNFIYIYLETRRNIKSDLLLRKEKNQLDATYFII